MSKRKGGAGGRRDAAIDEGLLSKAEASRAQAVADAAAGASVAMRDLFSFRVGPIDLAVDVPTVTAVIDVTTPTPVPGCPAFILGVVSHGERILPVLDVAKLLEIGMDGAGAAAGEETYRRLLVVSSDGLDVALLCDRVRGLVQVADAEVAAPSVLQGTLLRRYLAAEVDLEQGVTGVLDLGTMLEAARVL